MTEETKEIEPQGEYQLVIQNDHIVGNKYAVPILWNKEALKIGLKNALAKHKDVVYTDDKLPEAKSQRAKLNGLRTTLDNERKRIKNECLEFYQQFELDVKELMALVDEPINTIDAQLDVYEQRRIDEKTEACKAIYNEIFTPDIAEVMPFAEIFQTKWMNKGCKLDEVRQNIADKYQMINTGIATVKALNSKHQTALIKTFLATMDMGAVLKDKADYEQMDIREEMRKKAEAERQTEREKLAADKAKAIAGFETPPYVVAAPAAAKTEPEPLLSVVFKVITTKSKMDALKAYIKENNIKIERV